LKTGDQEIRSNQGKDRDQERESGVIEIKTEIMSVMVKTRTGEQMSKKTIKFSLSPYLLSSPS
jgi:hypothetical protein